MGTGHGQHKGVNPQQGACTVPIQQLKKLSPTGVFVTYQNHSQKKVGSRLKSKCLAWPRYYTQHPTKVGI